MHLYERGENPVFGGRLGRFLIPKDEACDLDAPEDWNIAEGILMSRQELAKEERYLAY
jgi:CMP-N-acetylneuraminic acid synthetase